MNTLCTHCCAPECVFEAKTLKQRDERMNDLLPNLANTYYFYFKPTKAYLPKLLEQLPSNVVNDNGTLIVEQTGRDNAQAFLDQWISLDVRRTDAIVETLPYAQRVSWILHYENVSPDFKASYIKQMAIHRWPNEHFDDEFTAAIGHQLDIPR